MPRGELEAEKKFGPIKGCENLGPTHVLAVKLWAEEDIPELLLEFAGLAAECAIESDMASKPKEAMHWEICEASLRRAAKAYGEWRDGDE